MNGNGNHPPDWLDSYIACADARSPMTPRDFHEGIGLWLISTTVARRLVVRMAHDDVYPNVWVMVAARSTMFAKSTAFKMARRYARRAIGHLLLPDTSTPEALVEVLSGRNLEGEAKTQAGQKGLILDEASGMLAQAGRDYMAGSLELLLHLHDCPDEYERLTRVGGRCAIKGAYLTLLGASTPAMLAPHLKAPRMWANGWWPRFGILPQPDVKPPYRQSTAPAEQVDNALIDALGYLHRRLPSAEAGKAPEALSVVITGEALRAFGEYDRLMRYDRQTDDLPDSLSAVYGRSPTQALKVATCLAATDWPDGERVPMIELRHWVQAQEIAERWAVGAERALDLAEAQREDHRVERVLRAVAKAGDWISLRDLCRMTKLRAVEVELALVELAALGEIEQRDVKRGNYDVQEARLARREEVPA
jgi:hypothetical protein